MRDPQDSVTTVLVVDDEDAVRSLLRTLLRLAGYEALACRDGAEALDLLAARGGDVQLLITDINLGPDMDGFELADALRASQPALKVLFISGDEAERAGREMASGHTQFLAKPFTPRAFTDTARALLAAANITVSAS